MENKENDLLLTMTSNPLFSLGNLKDMGLNVENTSLASKETYEGLKEVQDIFKNSDGSFNQEKFDKFYDASLAFYNELANEDFDLKNALQTTFDKYDIYAPQEKKNFGPNIDIVRIANPDRLRKGTIRLWRTEAPTMSRDEIAQTQKILLNPVKSAKGEEEIWGNTPNDSFFKDFFKTRVLATWDEDGTHIDPYSGREIEHKKGEYKLNKEGTYFYEDLDGRDIYGKQVLNKLNVITKDGSKINKYDIFDSDDLDQKSAGKTLLKNAALVGSMWIPYVGWGIAAASIASQLAGVGATFAKMLTGSDNATLSAIEGWSKSVSRQGARSQYAQENTWCWENFINTIGDVVGQLKEQRFLFEKFPALIKGKGGLNPEKLEAEYLAKEKAVMDKKVKELIDNFDPKFAPKIKELNGIARYNAAHNLKTYMDSYNNIGRVVSQAYMTAITVQDAYGEAKANGASDLEAAALMLGYTAAEYMIINSELGRWILPETRADRYKNVAIANALIDAKAVDTSTKEGKKKLVKKLFDYGKKIATSDYANGTKTIKATLASGFGEGFEEVSEELLQDVSYSLLNLSRWLRGEDKVMTPWENMADRYGMSFVGGFFGGGITNSLTNYRMLKSYDGMDFNKATQELVYMVRNGEINDFMKSLDKMDLGNKHLSALKYKEQEDGTLIWDPGTKDDNLDKALKDAIRQQVADILQIINSNNLNISDDSFLKGLTDIIKDLKLSFLQNSATAGRFLQEFNTVTLQIVDVTQHINDLAKAATNDLGKTVDENANLELANERKKLTDLLKQKDDLLQGKRSPEFIRDAIVELSPILQVAPVTFYMYAEKKSGKKYEEIEENVLKQYAEEYDKYQNGELKDDVHDQAEILESFLHQLTTTFELHKALFEAQMNDKTFTELKTRLANIMTVFEHENPDVEVSMFLENYMYRNYKLLVGLIQMFGSESDKTRLQQDIQQMEQEQDGPIREQLLQDFLLNYSLTFAENVSSLVEPVLKQGYLNSEEKILLIDLLKDVQSVVSDIALKLEDLNEQGFASVDTKYLWDQVKTLEEYQQQVEELHHLPIEEFLNNFSVQITGQPFDITKIIEEINKQLELFSDDLSQYQIDNDLEGAIKQGLQLLDFYEMAIEASRTDNGDIDNLFGFSSTLNKANQAAGTEGYIPLAEISGEMANVLTQDLRSYRTILQYASRLFAINQGQKFLQQDKVALNKRYITYNALVAFSKALSLEPDKWKGLDKLNAALDNATLHKENYQTKKLDLREDKKTEIEREAILLENALFDFISENISSLDSREDRIKKWKELFNPKNINFYYNKGELLTAQTTQLDPSDLIWYLVSRGAIKSSAFNGRFKEIISQEIAPLPAQLSNIYLNYAFAVNGDIFAEAQEALNEITIEDWKAKSIAEREDILEKNNKGKTLAGDEYADLVLNFGLNPNFRNIVLTDGIPGSGKTRAVIDYTVRMLKKFNPEVLRKVAIINTSDETSKKLGLNLGLNDFSSFSHAAFLQYALANSKIFVQNRDTGLYEISEDDWKFDDKTKELDSTFDIASLDDVPSLIIIDEVSRYNYFELKAIDNFAKKYGITVIAAGDFNLDGAIGTHRLKYNDLEVPNEIKLVRLNFIHSLKLGVSMRTRVQQMSNAVKSLLAYIEDPIDSFPEFHYVENEDGLFGVKVSFKDVDGNIRDTEKVMKSIDLMISKLEKGEKIGYIYDQDSEITKILSQDKYKDVVELYKGSSAQGLEGKYYIVDLNVAADETSPRNEVEEKFLRQLYTAISRSELGVLLLINDDNFKESFGFPHVGVIPVSRKDSKVLYETYSKESIAAQSQRYIDRLNKFDFLNPDDNTYKGRSKDNDIPVKPKLNDEAPTDVVPEEKRQEKVDLQSQSEDIPPFTPEGALNMLLFSFNTFGDFGFTVDKNGKLTPRRQSLFDSRIDGINGLLKLNRTLDFATCQKIIGRLRSAIFNISDKAELNKEISKILKRIGFTDPNITCEFGIKSGLVLTDNDPNYNSEYEGYDHYADEEILYNHSLLDPNTTRAKEKIRKNLIIRIGVGSDVKLEIPLFTLMNPLTLISSKQNGKPIYPELIEFWNSLPDSNNFYDKCSALISKFGTNPLYKEIIDLFKLFVYTKRDYFVIEDQSWTPSKDLKNYGIQYTSRKGQTNYEVGGFTYNGKWERFDEFLSNLDPSLKTTKIMINDSIEDNPKIKVPKGTPFILITDDVRLSSDDAIVKAFIEGSEHVHMVTLTPPKASIESYLNNLRDILLGNKTSIRNIGNDLTSYRLVKILLNKQEFLNEFENQKEYLTEIRRAIDTISQLEKEGKSLSDIIDLLLLKLDWKNPNSKAGPKSAIQFLNRVLIDFVRQGKEFGDPNGYDKIEFDSQLVGLLTRLLKEEDILYVAYDVILDKDRDKRPRVGGTFALVSDDNTIAVRSEDNGNFWINGKIDSPVFGGNLAPIISRIVSKLTSDRRSDQNYKNHQMSTIKTRSNEVLKALDIVKDKLGMTIDYSNEMSDEEIMTKIISEVNSSGKGLAFNIKGIGFKVLTDDRIFNGTGLITFATEENGDYNTELPALLFNSSTGEATVFFKISDLSYMMTIRNSEVEINSLNESPTPIVNMDIASLIAQLEALPKMLKTRFEKIIANGDIESLITLLKQPKLRELLKNNTLNLTFNVEELLNNIDNNIDMSCVGTIIKF